MAISYLRRAYSSFAAHVFDIPPRLMALLFFLILLLLPTCGLSSYYMGILISTNIIAIFALSWDLLVGRTGLISLGHALFFGVGGYSTALLFRHYGLPLWITIPVAVLLGALAGMIIGVPCLKVRGPYLALVTMAFPLIVSNIIKWSPLNPVFKGEIGIRASPFFPFLPIRQQRIAEYYLTLLLLFISAVIIYKIANSKTGIVFISILDDEVAAKACGINVTKYKIMSFIISSMFASLAGSIQAHFLKNASPSMFSLTLSFVPIIVTFLGGIGSIYGAIVGTYIYYILDKYVLIYMLPVVLRNFNLALPRGFEHAKLIIFTSIVLIFIIKWPRGIARYVIDKLQDLEEARDLDERGPRIWKRYKKKEKS